MKILPGFLLCFLLLPGAAWAQVTLQIDPATPVPSSVTAGSSFSLNLDLNNQTGTGVAGYDVDVESLVYDSSSSTYVPVSNDFSLTGVTLTSSALNLPNSTLPTPGAPIVLDPQAGSSSQPLDLGASNLFTDETLGTGVSPLETLALQVAATAAPGTYELEFFAINGNAQGPVTISDNDGNSIGTSATPFYSNSFTVASAPEPPVVWLFAVAMTLFFSIQAVWKRNGLARG
jgi:hypothetical protein